MWEAELSEGNGPSKLEARSVAGLSACSVGEAACAKRCCPVLFGLGVKYSGREIDVRTCWHRAGLVGIAHFLPLLLLLKSGPEEKVH